MEKERMNQTNRWLLPLLIAALAVAMGCTGVRVSQDYDPEADFARLQGYAWQTDKDTTNGNPLADNPLLQERIRNAVEQTLAAKGFRQVARGEADFLVKHRYQVRQKVGSENVRTGIGIGTGGSGTFGGIGVSTGGGVREYNEGTLVIDIIDAGTGELLWRGMGSREVFTHSDPEKTTRAVNETVAKILQPFPPAMQ
jgi:hypothetical protein